MHADALMFGCAAALLEGTGWFERIYRRMTQVWWLPVAGLAVGSYLEMRYQNYWNFPVGETYAGVLIAVVLLWTIRNAESLPGRVLNARWVTHIGVLSYSIYLWQTLLLHHSNAGVFAGVPWIGQFPFNWVAVLIAAEISYFVVEQPSLRLRNRLLRRTHVYQAPARSAFGAESERHEVAGSVK